MKILVTLFALTVLPSLGSAALIDRGNGFIYDSDLNITLLQDANYSFTSGYDDDGRMNWYEATDWVNQLEYGGYSDWRLPSSANLGVACVDQNQDYFACPDTELGYLYFKESDSLDIFFNVQSYQYWSGTLYTTQPISIYYINFATGYQGLNGYSFPSYAWAVRDGDVAAVPEPESLYLFIGGLVILAGLIRSKKA